MQSTTTLPKLTEAGVKALRILAGEEGNAAPAAVAKLKRDGYADESGALTQAGRKAYVSMEGNARRACYLSDCRHSVSGTTALNLLMHWPASDTNTRQVPSCTLHHNRVTLVDQPAVSTPVAPIIPGRPHAFTPKPPGDGSGPNFCVAPCHRHESDELHDELPAVIPGGMEDFVTRNIDLLPEYAGTRVRLTATVKMTRVPRKVKKANKRKATRATRRRNRGAK